MEHNHGSDSRQIDRKVLRVQIKRRAREDVSARHAKIIRSELFTMVEENLRPSDISIVCQALYKEGSKKYTKLPRSASL